jgi:DNA-binding winged helix-turn-helix (wHTH) protein
MLKLVDVKAHASTPAAYLFGGFRLEVGRRLLSRESRIVPIPERIFQILLMLVEAEGSVVEREAIAIRVWPDSAVADGNIAQHVYLLRRILGEHARDHGLVMAVNRRGYRLTVPVTAEVTRAPDAIGSGVALSPTRVSAIVALAIGRLDEALTDLKEIVRAAGASPDARAMR